MSSCACFKCRQSPQQDADVSIRRRALELVYALVNESNIQALTTELLDYLKVQSAVVFQALSHAFSRYQAQSRLKFCG